MEKLRIMLSVDHMGRVGQREGDRGAAGGGLHEVDMTWRIAEGFYRAARDTHNVIICTHGDYRERHGWANRCGVDVYLALHINSSSKTSASYGAFFYHPETSPGNGDALAESMAVHLEQLVTTGISGADGVKKRKMSAYKAKAIKAEGDTWKNPRYVIGHLSRPIGICCEPFFISHAKSRELFGNDYALLDVGRTYYAAVEDWHAKKSGGIS